MTRCSIHTGWVTGICLIVSIGLTANSTVRAEDDTVQAVVEEKKTAPVDTSNAAETMSVSKPKDKSAWKNFAPPPDDKFDWIQLTSGEWLKGELKALYNFSLEFDSDELDLLHLDWEDIKQIRTADAQSLRIENTDSDKDPTTVIGILHLKSGEAAVSYGDNVLKFKREQIISIAEGENPWSGKVSLGVNIRSGNSDLVDSSFLGTAQRRTAASRFVIDYVGNYSRAESIDTSNNHRLNSYYDSFKTSKFFWRLVTAEYYRDSFKNIDHQLSAGTSFGYHFIRTPKTEWEVSGGIGLIYKRFVSVEQGEDIDNVSPLLSVGTKYDTEFTHWLDNLFEFSFSIVDENSGSYLHHLITTLSSDLISDLDIDISFVWDRVQDPQPASDGEIPERDDFQLIVGIGYEF